MSRLKSRRWGVLVLALALAAMVIIVASCGEEEEGGGAAAATPKPGGTYNFGIPGEPVGIAPVTYQESTGYHIVHEIFQGLVKYEMQPDGTMATKPDIAESWTVSDDLKVWTFKLKKGVTFQPPVSREVKAQDFVASWNFVTDSKNWVSGTPAWVAEPIVGADSAGAAAKGLTGVKALDDYTLQVTLKYGFAEFDITTGHPFFSVWPVDYAKQIGIKKYNKNPVGTGPYMFKEWKPNQYVDLVKNPNWWAASDTNGPFIDKLHFAQYLEPATMWLAFQKGDLDFTDVPAGQVAAAEAMAKTKGWTAKKWPTISTYFVCFNMKDKTVGGPENLPLRQALAYGADINAVINVVREGVPLVPTGLVPVGIPGWDLSELPYPYDPEKAKELVAQIGDIPTLQYWYNTGSDHDKVAVPLQAGWKAVGIDVKLTGIEWGTFLVKLQEGKETEFYRLGWSSDYPSMDNFLFPLAQSEASGVNMGVYYSNPQVDDLLTQARATADETQRLNLYAEAEKIVLADVVYIPIYFYREFQVTNPRVANQIYNPMNVIDMWKCWVAE